jgi:N-acetylmuramoyl-L-alanine amidase
MRMNFILSGFITSAVIFMMTPAQANTLLDNATAKDINCLALNVYFEAKAEPRLGKRAVAFATLNRVADGRWDDTICEVVYSGEFSWTDDGGGTPTEKENWAESVSVAISVLADYGQEEDPTEGAVMFHNTSVKPSWRKRFERVVQIDGHIFYR